MKFLKSKLTLFFSLILLSGCSALRSTKPFGLSGLQPLSSKQADEILVRLAADSAQINSFRLAGKLTVRGGGNSSQLMQTVVFERPHSLRAEVFAGPVNTWTGIVISTDNSVLSYVAAERTAYEGPITLCVTERVLSVPLLPEEFALWLTGRVFLPPASEIERHEVLSGENGALVVKLYLIDGRLVEILMSVGKDDEGRTSIKAFDVRRASDRRLLFSSVRGERAIDFSIPEKGVTGSYAVSKLSLNPDLSALREKLFQFTYPPGTTVERLKGTCAWQ